jgi:hypothetical protein
MVNFNITPNIYIFAALIIAYVACGEIIKVQQLLQQMNDQEVPWTVYIMDKLFTAVRL